MSSEKLLVSLDYAHVKFGTSESLKEATEDSLSEALLSSQRRIEVELDSRLQRGTSVDVFYTDSESFSGVQPDGFFRLYLTSGLLLEAPRVYIGEDNTGVEILSVRHSKNRGLVYLKNTEHSNMTISVYSTYGYEKAYDVPTILRDAIVSYAPAMFSSSAADNSSDPKKDYQVMVDHALALLKDYRRSRGFSLMPIY